MLTIADKGGGGANSWQSLTKGGGTRGQLEESSYDDLKFYDHNNLDEDHHKKKNIKIMLVLLSAHLECDSWLILVKTYVITYSC